MKNGQYPDPDKIFPVPGLETVTYSETDYKKSKYYCGGLHLFF